MKWNLTKRKKWMIGGVVLLATATPSFAILGLGDLVYDPVSLAELVTQATTMSNTLLATKQQLTTMENSVRNFSVKGIWQTALNTVKTVSVPNTYGETNGMSAAFNQNSPTGASASWTSSKVAVSSDATTNLNSQTVGNSAQLSELAIVETSDMASPDCINAVGSYRAARVASAGATQALEGEQFDESADSNSEVEQLNLLNAAQAQQLNEQQAQGVLHACLAQQMTIQNMQQRNAAAQDLNTWGFVQAQQTSNPSYNIANSGTWTTYLP